MSNALSYPATLLYSAGSNLLVRSSIPSLGLPGGLYGFKTTLFCDHLKLREKKNVTRWPDKLGDSSNSAMFPSARNCRTLNTPHPDTFQTCPNLVKSSLSSITSKHKISFYIVIKISLSLLNSSILLHWPAMFSMLNI